MNKKLLLIIFGAVAFVASIFISATVDPAAAKFKNTMVKFHNASDMIYVDGDLKEAFIPKIDAKIEELGDGSKAEELKKVKEKTELAIEKLTEILSRIDPEDETKSIFIKEGVDKADVSTLIEKTKQGLKGFKEIIAVLSNLEKSVPADFKADFKESFTMEESIDGKTVKFSRLKKLKKLYDDSQIINTGMGGKRAMRFILIFLIFAVFGALFILVENKARKTKEIKAAEVA